MSSSPISASGALECSMAKLRLRDIPRLRCVNTLKSVRSANASGTGMSVSGCCQSTRYSTPAMRGCAALHTRLIPSAPMVQIRICSLVDGELSVIFRWFCEERKHESQRYGRQIYSNNAVTPTLFPRILPIPTSVRLYSLWVNVS